MSRISFTTSSRGKKSAGNRLVYDALDLIEERPASPRWMSLNRPLKNVGPVMEVRPAALVVRPIRCQWKFRRTGAWLWPCAGSFRLPALARAALSMRSSLAELLDAATNQGAAVRKREETHKMAEANRAFSHYRV